MTNTAEVKITGRIRRPDGTIREEFTHVAPATHNSNTKATHNDKTES